MEVIRDELENSILHTPLGVVWDVVFGLHVEARGLLFCYVSPS